MSSQLHFYIDDLTVWENTQKIKDLPRKSHEKMVPGTLSVSEHFDTVKLVSQVSLVSRKNIS